MEPRSVEAVCVCALFAVLIICGTWIWIRCNCDDK